MALQFSVALRNAMLDSMETTIGVSAKLQLWSGTVPANCAATATGTKLAEYTMASDWAAAASGGTKGFTPGNLPLTTTAIVGGTIGYYRITDSAGASTSCHEQGTVTATGGGGDLTVDNPTVTTSQTINVTSFTKTAPGA